MNPIRTTTRPIRLPESLDTHYRQTDAERLPQRNTMTTERDELAKVIVAAYGEDAEAECPCEQDLDVADAILAAGYIKPRQVSTVEELDALPNEALVRTPSGQVWEAAKVTGGENYWRTLGPAKVLSSAVLGRWNLPATVLYSPVVAP